MSRWANIAFVVVFLYTIFALLFWHQSLQKQNRILYAKNLEIAKLKLQQPNLVAQEEKLIQSKFERKTKQYYGEGATFLLFIISGGFIVYFSFKKRLQLSTQQNNFMMSITHELKSPLAGIKLGLETIGRHNLSDDQKQKLISNSLGETDRLDELCNNILLSTQLDGKQYRSHKQNFNFIGLVQECVDAYTFRYPSVEWEFHSYTKVQDYLGDISLWRFAINNLLENAIKYAPESKVIVVDLYQAQNNLVLQIIDQGKGISDADKKKIFQKFYRAGNENVRKSKGTGLGLFIVKNAVERHGGIIEMLDNQPHGNIVHIIIPLSYE